MGQARNAYPFGRAVALDGTVAATLDADSWDAIALQWYTGAANAGSASAITLYGTVSEDVPASSADVRWDLIGGVGFADLPAAGEGASEVVGVPAGYRTILIEIEASTLSAFTLAARLGTSR